MNQNQPGVTGNGSNVKLGPRGTLLYLIWSLFWIVPLLFLEQGILCDFFWDFFGGETHQLVCPEFGGLLFALIIFLISVPIFIWLYRAFRKSLGTGPNVFTWLIMIVLAVVGLVASPTVTRKFAEDKISTGEQQRINRLKQGEEKTTSPYVSTLGNNIVFNNNQFSFQLPNSFFVIKGQDPSTSYSYKGKNIVTFANGKDEIEVIWPLQEESSKLDDQNFNYIKYNNTVIKEAKSSTTSSITLKISLTADTFDPKNCALIRLEGVYGVYDINDLTKAFYSQEGKDALEQLKQSFKLL